jgi:O-antigen ligase
VIPVAVDARRWDGSFSLPLLLAAMAAIVLTVVPYPQNAVLIAAGAAFVLAVFNPPVALGVLVASVPIQSIGGERLGSVNLTMTKVLLLSIAASWAIRVLTERRRIRLDRLAFCYAAYVVVLGLSIVNALEGSSWGQELYRWWSPLLTYVIAINTLREPGQTRWILVGTAGAVIGTSLYGFVQVARGIGPEAFNVNGLLRAYSTFGQPNPFAGYLGVTVPLLAAVVGGWWLARSRAGSPALFPTPLIVLAATATGMGLVALVLTQSRGGWIGAAAGLGAVAWLLGQRMRLAAVGIGVVVLLAAVATPLGARLGGRLFDGAGVESQEVLVTPQNFAVQERLAHWRAGWAMAKRYPLLGVGAGNYPDRFREFTPVWRFRISRGHAHNAYIQAAAQTGFLGLGAYAVFLGGVASMLFTAWRAAGDGPYKPLVVGAIGVSVAFAVHNVFDYLHVLSLPIQLASAWALACTTIPRGDRTARRTATRPTWQQTPLASPPG